MMQVIGLLFASTTVHAIFPPGWAFGEEGADTKAIRVMVPPRAGVPLSDKLTVGVRL